MTRNRQLISILLILLLTPFEAILAKDNSVAEQAHAAAQLVQAGKLDLDLPIQTYVPDFPQKRGPITTRQLLGHLSDFKYDAITISLAQLFMANPEAKRR